MHDNQVIGRYYIDYLDNRTCELVSFRIDPPYRGQNLSHEALRSITNEADKKGYALLLQVKPEPGSPLNAEQLVALYAQHGFKKQNSFMFRSRRS